MPRVAVVSDTTSYMPRHLVASKGIRLVSLYVNFGGERSERESDMADFDYFYRELCSGTVMPTTSRPSVADFVEVYEPLLAAGHEIVSVHISSGLSGTCEAAGLAAESLEREGKGGERVTVIDSATAGAALGLLSLAAARAAETAPDAAAVTEVVAEARAGLKMWACLDTLEFLKRGGRIGAASAWIGSTLKIKPIVTVESEITPVERVRTSRRMFERMVEYASQRHASGADAWTVQHVRAPDQAEKLADRCREVFGCEPEFVAELGPVIGCHTGPGMLGVAAMAPRFLRAA